MKYILSILLLAATATAQDFEFGIGQRGQVTKGLVSYWSMRNSGTTVYDEWGTNTGTAVNGPVFAYTNGVVGQGARFDGTNTIIRIARNSGLEPTNISVSVWAWAETFSDGQKPIVIKTWKNNTLTHYYSFGISFDRAYNNKLEVFIGRIGSTYSVHVQDTASLFDDGNCHHIVAMLDDTNDKVYLYIDGVKDLDAAETYSIAYGVDSTSDWYIGGDQANEAGAFSGSIDEVRIYNRALTAVEIQQLYRMGKTINDNR